MRLHLTPTSLGGLFASGLAGWLLSVFSSSSVLKKQSEDFLILLLADLGKLYVNFYSQKYWETPVCELCNFESNPISFSKYLHSLVEMM